MMSIGDEELGRRLRRVMPPVNSELRRDLWPEMLRKLDSSSRRIPWYDWALVVALSGILTAFPRFILLFAFHV